MSLVFPPLAVLVAMSLVMAVGWWWQKRTKNGGWIDVFWTYGTGICGVALALFAAGPWPPSPRAMLVAALVGLWSLRLGTYIALRVGRSPREDTRYTELKKEWGGTYDSRMFGFMQVQSPATVALCLAVLLAASKPGDGLGLTDILGALILLGCIVGEGLADAQMAAFRADPANHGRICDTGLWGLSRHPNYLFEFLGWVAYPVIAFDPQQPLWLAAFLAPVAMYGVLRFGTGVPPLEKIMLQSRGDRFRAYQARVPLLIPIPLPRPKLQTEG